MGLSESPEFSDIINTSYVAGSVSVTTSQVEAKVSSSPLAHRQLLVIYNNGNLPIYYGPFGVTTSTGVKINKNEFVVLPVGDLINIFLITSTSSSSAAIQEFA